MRKSSARKIHAVGRPSPVSDQVRTLFDAEGRHLWSIDELHTAVVESLGAADYSTVFRAVVAMERDGDIQRIDLGDGKVHYELSDEHHEHIRCDSCGRVVTPGQAVLHPLSDAAVVASDVCRVVDVDVAIEPLGEQVECRGRLGQIQHRVCRDQPPAPFHRRLPGVRV